MRLFFLLFTMASMVLAGGAVTAVLAMNMPGWQPIVIAAGLGAAVAVPVALWASKKIAAL